MPETQAPTLVILLALCAGLLVVTLFLIVRMSRKLSRIESFLTDRQPESTVAAPGAAETLTGGAFEEFLTEDPARRDLPKAQQASAYRAWRQQKGMNWSNS
ncbi:hypothetical protein HQ447_14575 [bacterium]|nr:hypothetical protein [bacterium]